MNEPQLNINLKNTQSIPNFDGGSVFQQGFVVRKLSKFVLGTDEDAIIPIPVFYDPSTKKILKSSLPTELREEYEDECI
jgi:hypothetical protein